MDDIDENRMIATISTLQQDDEGINSFTDVKSIYIYIYIYIY